MSTPMANRRTVVQRIARAVDGHVRSLRALPVLHPAAMHELWSASRGRHRVDPDHSAHLSEALAWLARAQDATPDDGIARGFSLSWNPHFRSVGWQPSYPETTGYLIPTLFSAARTRGEPSLAERAERAARWEISVQLESGAVQGGVIGEPRSPAVFNTGQVILGWLSALEETGREEFASAARRAGRYLVDTMDADGHWRRGNSRFARPDATLYNARVAWALAEAGVRLTEPTFTEAAARNLRAVAELQHRNGWFPNACLYRPDRPLLHTLAYTVRGLLEGGRVLGDAALVESAARTAAALARQVREDGWISGQFDKSWVGRASWSCLTGNVQMANNWMRLHEITGEVRWLEPVPRVLGYVKSTQNRTSANPGIRGGIRGSEPVSGEYGRYEILNWATKYFADALMRHAAIRAGAAPSSLVSVLA